MVWRILGVMMILWGGALLARWVLQGFPLHLGGAYAMGKNTALVLAVIVLGLGALIFKRSFKKASSPDRA